MVTRTLNIERWLTFVAVTFSFWSCSYPFDSQGRSEYSDDFERSGSYDSLFTTDNSRWTFTQQTLADNRISIDTNVVHGAKQSCRFEALRSGDVLSKCSISKSNMYFAEGELVEFSAWYYIVGTASMPYLFLVDLEEKVAVGAGPGIRIALDQDGQSLEVERGKMGASTLHQSAAAKPLLRDQWVNIRFQIKLSPSTHGSVRLWQNNDLLIEAFDIQTMPHDILYFIQGTKGVYNSFEIGITANTDKSDCIVYVDDVRIWKVE